LVIEIDTADGRDRHDCPPWSNFRNYVILADNHRTPRGIMRVAVFYFPTDCGIDIAEERIK
jgi:poly(3-hydroxybutyrate) depolymerase